MPVISPGYHPCWPTPSGVSGKESAYQCKRHGFDPWIRKNLWRGTWQPTIVFLPGKFHGQRNLAGYSPWGHKVLDTTEHAHPDPPAIGWRFPWTLPQVLLIHYCGSQNSETFYLLDHQFIRKSYNSGTARWKRYIGRGTGEVLKTSELIFQCPSNQELPETSIVGLLWRLYCMGLIE